MKTEAVSFCGNYLCSRCAYHRGVFVEYAKNLYALSQDYKSLRLIAEAAEVFNFDEFLKGLKWLASQTEPCKGCRRGGGWSWWPDCPVRICCTEKQVDLCYQCQEFPCTKLTSGPLKERLQRFIDANHQIQQLGLQAWIVELKKKYSRE